MAGGALGQVFAALRGRRPQVDREAPPQARDRRQPVALVQPDHRLLPLPPAAGRAGTVPVGVRDAGGIAPSPVGPADRGRVPQPHAGGLRRGQPALPDARDRRASVRAPPVPLRDPAQRPHPILHRPTRNARPGPLLAHQRDEPGHASAGRRSGRPEAEARRQRGRFGSEILPAEPAPGAAPREQSARSGADGRLRRVPHRRRWTDRRRNAGPPPGRDLRRRGSRQAPSLLSRGVRRLVAPHRAGNGRGRRLGRRREGGRTRARPGDGRRPGSAAAPGHRGHRRGRLAAQPPRRARARNPPDPARRRRPRFRSRRASASGPNAHPRRPLRPAGRADRGAAPPRRPFPERRAADRLHRVQDDAGLPCQPPAEPVSGRQDPDALRGGRSGRHGRHRARRRQGRLQRPRRPSPRPDRHRRRRGGAQSAPHGPLPAPLRLSLEPVAAGAAQRPPRPLRTGPRRDGPPLRQRRRPGHPLPGPRDPQGRRHPRGPGIRQRDLRPRRATSAAPGGGPGGRPERPGLGREHRASTGWPTSTPR